MKKLHRVEVATHDEIAEQALPEAVAAALGELAGAPQEGLLALSVGVGLGVLESLLEEGTSCQATRKKRWRSSTHTSSELTPDTGSSSLEPASSWPFISDIVA